MDKNKIIHWVCKIVFSLLMIMISIILVLNLVFQNKNYHCRKEFLLPNFMLLPLALMAYFFVFYILNKFAVSDKPNDSWKKINAASFILFFLLVYISLNIYFSTGWDAGYVLYDAKTVANGGIVDGTYYSQFPNQQMLLIIESALFKLNDMFGVIDSENGMMILIIIQCLIVAVTGNLVYRVLNDFLHKPIFAWIGWGTFCILLGLSGWITIPYTDGMSLFYPILILRCFQRKESCDKNKYGWWGTIVFLSYWGFKTKPTALIIFIAIIIVEGIYKIAELNKTNMISFAKIVTVSFIVLFVSNAIFKSALGTTGITVNRELDTGALHMIMMGLNDENDGVWAKKDAALSVGIANKSDRKEMQINVIKQRLEDYGLKGLLRHTARKSLVIFNDGTFAWGMEGKFYYEVYEVKNQFISPLLRDMFYSTGGRYQVVATVEQAIWLAVLFLSGCCIFLRKDKFTSVICISLIGIILFNYLFEARARYVMIYVPIFIVLGICSIEVLNGLIQRKVGYISLREKMKDG